MTRVFRFGILGLTLLLATSAAAQSPSAKTLAGLTLSQALAELQSRGLKIVFSSELVTPAMRVTDEPKARQPRKILDEVLKPHGLQAKAGPSGTLLVVKTRKEPDRAVSAAPAAATGPGVVRGRVVEARTGEALPGVVVVVQRTGAETVTDASGRFQLSNVPSGSQPLFVSLVGYGLARPIAAVPAGGSVELTVPLADGTGTYSEEVSVVADRFRGPDTALPSQQLVTSADLLELRGVLTDDPFRALQALPGVASSNDFRSDFAVRGGDRAHLGLSIDGILTRWPVHDVRDHEDTGSISMINGDILDAVTLTAGLYPQDRPGRTGSWLDMSIRDGSRARTQVHAGVSATSSSVVVEGPIGGAKRGSWLASIRQSYVQWLLGVLSDKEGLAFGFTDAQVKTKYDVTARQQLQVTFVGGHSRLDNTDQNPNGNSLLVGSRSSRLLTATWRSMIGRVVLTQQAAVSGDSFTNNGPIEPVPASGSETDATFRSAAVVSAGPGLTLQTGVYAQRMRDDETFVRYADTAAGHATLRQVERINGHGWESSVFGRATWQRSRLQLDGGVLGSTSHLTHQTFTSPWGVGSIEISKQLTLRAGRGLYQQHPELAQVIGTFGRPDVRAERAWQTDVSAEYRPSPSLSAVVTVYDRHNENALRLEGAEPRVVDGHAVYPSGLPIWVNAVDGDARGVELSLQRRSPTGLSGWISYAYGRARNTDTRQNETYWADFDQRHTFNAQGLFRVTSKTNVGAKLRIGSGLPIVGYFENRPSVAVQRPDLGHVFLSETKNALRLPTYARLDLRANHTFNYKARRLTLFVEIVNFTRRTNYGRDDPSVYPDARVFGSIMTMFPFLPSAGILIDF